MTKEITIKLAQARKWADKIVAELDPLCDRIEVAGSIRRRRPEVHDIDIVCIPKLKTAVNARVSRSASKVLCSGPHNLSVLLANGVQLDVYYGNILEEDLFNASSPRNNWGSLFLARTGPALRHMKTRLSVSVLIHSVPASS